MAEASPSALALAAVLDGVLSGEVDLLKFLDKVDPMAPEYAACFHGLWHFASDQDIRAKDVKYADMQRACMLELIARLRIGDQGERLSEISFLSWPHSP